MTTQQNHYKAYCLAALRAEIGVAIDTSHPMHFQSRISAFISQAKKLRPEFAALSTVQAPNGKQVWILNNAERKSSGRNRNPDDQALSPGRGADPENVPIAGRDDGSPPDRAQSTPPDGGGSQQENGQ